MKIDTKQTGLTLEQIEAGLKAEFPECEYFYRKNLTGRHLVVQASAAIGLGIWMKDGTARIEHIIPSFKLALLLGAASSLLFLFNRQKRADFMIKVIEYITVTYQKN